MRLFTSCCDRDLKEDEGERKCAKQSSGASGPGATYHRTEELEEQKRGGHNYVSLICDKR